MLKKIWLIAFAILVLQSNGIGQATNVTLDTISKESYNPLKGLRKAEQGEIAPNTRLNPNITPMLHENLSLIQGDDFNKIMMSGDYKPEAYIDSNKEIKAFVLRKLTEIEKVQMKQRQSKIQNNNPQSTLINKNNNPLEGLRKAEQGEIAPGTHLYPNITPMLYEDLSLIQVDDFTKIIKSGDYKPEAYIDSNKVIKAYVLRKLTEIEKVQMEQRQSKIQINNSQSTLINKNNNPLEGLRKAEQEDIPKGTQIKLNPNTTPMFHEDLTLIQGDDFSKIMMSGDYKPEPYIDSNKEIKAFVLVKLTDIEKEQRKKMRDKMQNQNRSELIGKEAFPFSVKDIYGNKYSLDKLKGKVIVLNFWFIECKPCVMEMPELNDIVEKYKGKEVVFLGFATNDLSKIESFLKTKTFKYNIIADNEEIAEMYKVRSYPTHIIIDTNSIISYSSTGLGPNTIKDLDNTIESLLK